MISKNSLNMNVREIKLCAESLQFVFYENKNQTNQIVLNAGSKYICERFFKGDLPQDDEVEISIYYVEELVLENKELKNNNEWFKFNHTLLAEIFGKNIGETISFDEVEEVNHKYFDVIAGVPESVIRIDFSKEKFTVLMILRAIMHVLKIKQIEIA